MAITIKNLIGGSINIVTGGGTSERWVKPQYTDDWVFSDGKEHSIFVVDYWDYDDPMNGMVYYEIDGGDCYGIIYRRDHMDWTAEKALEELDKMTVLDCGGNYIAYRKYIPGHWEDADRNWINGSWGDWNSVISGYEVEDGEQYGNPNVWYFIGDGMPSAELQKSSNLALWYGDFSGKSNIPFATRTWNNTKPAPAA